MEQRAEKIMPEEFVERFMKLFARCVAQGIVEKSIQKLRGGDVCIEEAHAAHLQH